MVRMYGCGWTSLSIGTTTTLDMLLGVGRGLGLMLGLIIHLLVQAL